MENCFSSPKIFIFLLLLLMGLCFQSKQSQAQSGLLPKQELDALREIASQIGKTDWDFNTNPCDVNNTNWNTPKNSAIPNYHNTVICNCSFLAGVCHVQQMFLMCQDLAGVLPPSLAKLHFVTAIDFSMNYLSGTIPSEWSSLSSLQYMGITVNRLSGPIPDFLGSMTNITALYAFHQEIITRTLHGEEGTTFAPHVRSFCPLASIALCGANPAICAL